MRATDTDRAAPSLLPYFTSRSKSPPQIASPPYEVDDDDSVRFASGGENINDGNLRVDDAEIEFDVPRKLKNYSSCEGRPRGRISCSAWIRVGSIHGNRKPAGHGEHQVCGIFPSALAVLSIDMRDFLQPVAIVGPICLCVDVDGSSMDRVNRLRPRGASRARHQQSIMARRQRLVIEYIHQVRLEITERSVTVPISRGCEEGRHVHVYNQYHTNAAGRNACVI